MTQQNKVDYNTMKFRNRCGATFPVRVPAVGVQVQSEHAPVVVTDEAGKGLRFRASHL